MNIFTDIISWITFILTVKKVTVYNIISSRA